MSFWKKLLGLDDVTTKSDAGKTLSKLKTVHEYLDELAKVLQGTDIPVLEAVTRSAPWTRVAAESLGDALPPVRFVLSLSKKLTQISDPHALGYLACTLAYQRSLERALPKVLGNRRISTKVDVKRVRQATVQSVARFDTFRFSDAFRHPFIEDADKVAVDFVDAIGGGKELSIKLVGEVHQTFISDLKEILANRSTSAFFEPFRILTDLGSDEMLSRLALEQHIRHQRWKYFHANVLGVEPFALGDIYVGPRCRCVFGGDAISRSKNTTRGLDRHSDWDDSGTAPADRESDLLAETLLHISGVNEGANSPIIIEGPPGSGKSSFTLRLCLELVEEGLHPIRIELRNLNVLSDEDIVKRLAESVELGNEDSSASTLQWFEGDLFLDGTIFRDPTNYKGSTINRFVLVLDGWDEISVSTPKGFDEQMLRLLAEIQERFFKRVNIPVRVVLVGRPTGILSRSALISSETPVLQILPMNSEMVKTLWSNLAAASKAQRLPTSQPERWSLEGKLAQEVVTSMISEYRSYEKISRSSGAAQQLFPVETLGSPLLTHLTARLVANDAEHTKGIATSRGLLYKALVDLVVGRAGKTTLERPYAETQSGVKLHGQELRALLRRTAEAMTLIGEENVAPSALARLLDMDRDEIERRVEHLPEIGRLMISFFFKGGFKHLGCEFSHKSFREFFLAEHIVESIKRHSRDRAPTRSDSETDLSLSLGRVLGARKMSGDVLRFFSSLIEWELERSIGSGPRTARGSMPTETMDLSGWRAAVHSLAKTWEVWLQGEHFYVGTDIFCSAGPLKRCIDDMARLGLVLRNEYPTIDLVPTLTAFDRNFGSGLLQICCILFSHLDFLEDQEFEKNNFFSRVPSSDTTRTMFRPGGGGQGVMASVLGRVSDIASGGLDGGNPGFCLRGLDAAGSHIPGSLLSGVDLSYSELGGANLSHSDLRGANLQHACLHGADLSFANLAGAVLDRADLSNARLTRANLGGAALRFTNIENAVLRSANLRGTKLTQAVLAGADLSWCDLSDADLSRANLTRTNLSRTRLVGCTMDDVVLQGANTFHSEKD